MNVRSLISHRDVGLSALLLLLLVAIASKLPQFIALENLLDVFDDTAILILLALGQMAVLLTRGVDLSVASNVALCGMAAALLNQHFPQLGVLPVLALALMLGTLLGLINGLLVWRLQVPPIVATLGTLSIYRGMVFVLSGGRWVNSNQMSPEFLNFVRMDLFGITALSWAAIMGIASVFIFLRYTTMGRNLFAAGDHPEAAAYAGIDIGRSQCIAFTLSGALAGLCGYFWVSRFAVAYTDVALGFELQVIAACVIGGISIAGGIGTVAGVVLGCLFLGIIKNALPLIGLSPFWQMAVSGLVITIAVVINARARRPQGRTILQESAA